MTAPTHALWGAVSYAGACALAGHAPAPLALGVAAVAAWLPDADTPSTRAGRVLFPLAIWIERRWGHRSVTHSLVGWLVFALVLTPLLFLLPVASVWFGAALCGYASHLLGDAATKSGVPLLWPSRARFVFPGNDNLRFITGSKAEGAVFAVLLLVGLLLLPLSTLGARRILHLATGTLSGAVRDVEDWSQTHRLQAQIEGFDVLNQRLVSGTYHIVGRRGDGKLVVEHDGAFPDQNAQSGYWILADTGEETHRIAPRKVRVEQLGPRTDHTQVLRVQNLTFAALARALGQAAAPSLQQNDASDAPFWRGRSEGINSVLLTGEGECFPFPQDAASAPQDVPDLGLKTVVFTGQKVRFDLAQLRHLTLAGGRIALKSATLSVTLPGGARVPSVSLASRRATLLAPSLRRPSDFLVRSGDLVTSGQRLSRPFAQSIEIEPTPEQRHRQNQAEAAARELVVLEAEERALKRGPLWASLAESFRARRAVLEAQAAWQMPVPPQVKAPPPLIAPFDAVVEAVEWEPPTIPTQKGEVAQHTARVTLARIRR